VVEKADRTVRNRDAKGRFFPGPDRRPTPSPRVPPLTGSDQGVNTAHNGQSTVQSGRPQGTVTQGEVTQGSRLGRLKALRDLLTIALTTGEALSKEIPQLSRELRAVLAEIDALDTAAAEVSDIDRLVAEAADELADARRRRTDAQAGA
jgi:hypothetical protein